MPSAFDFMGASLPAGVTVTAGTWTAGAGITDAGSTNASTPYNSTPPSVGLTIPGITSETSLKAWLVVRMKATAAVDTAMRWGGVYFSGVDSSGSACQRFSFPVRQDGVSHTYNVWMGDYYLEPRQPADTDLVSAGQTDPCRTALGGADYKIALQQGAVRRASPQSLASPITIFPTFDQGSAVSGTVEFLKITDRPEGPACLVVEHVGPARAMNRVNQANTWGARIRNVGGVRASGLAVSFSPPAGVTISNLRIPDPIIPPDEDRTVFFDVTSTTANAWTSFSVTVTCAEGDSAVVAGRAWIDPAYTGGSTGQAPTPVPITGAAKPYKIGIFYFPPWGPSVNLTPTVVHSFEGRYEPGYPLYDSTILADWEIYWAVSHGIDYFSAEWIDGNDPDCEIWLGNGSSGFLGSRFISYMQFEMFYINDNNASSTTENRGHNSVKRYNLLTGTAAPSSGTGVNGDFFADTATGRLYGPKRSGAWDTVHYLTLMNLNDSAERYAVANFLNIIDRWRVYFQHAQYLKTAGGKYRCTIYKPIQLYNSVTHTTGYSAAADAGFARVMAYASTYVAGGPGVSWAGVNIPAYQGGSSSAPSTRFSAAGFDRMAMYGWSSYSQSVRVVPATSSNSYGKLQIWPREFRDAPGALLTLWGGYDHHRWKWMRTPDWATIGDSVETFTAQCVDAKAALTAAGQNEILISSWNEFSERSCLAPTGRTQFQYLRSLVDTFTTASKPAVVTPRDVGQTIAQNTGTYRWVQHPSAYPTEDGNAVTSWGVTIPRGSYPEITPSKPRRTLWTPIYAQGDPAPSWLPFTAADGTRLRGINEVRSLSASRYQQLGINLLRCRPSCTWTRVGQSEVYTPSIDWASFDAKIDALPPNVRIIIDPHSYPGTPGGSTTHSDNPIYWSKTLQDNACEYARQAGIYAQNKGFRIAGFDWLNEATAPMGGTSGSPVRFPPTFQDSSSISSYNTTLSALIAVWSQFTNPYWPGPRAVPAVNVGDQDPRSLEGFGNRMAAAFRSGNSKHPVITQYWYSGGTNGLQDSADPTNGQKGTGVNCGPGSGGANHNPYAWFVTDDPYWVMSWHGYDPPGYATTSGAPASSRPSLSTIRGLMSDIDTFRAAHPTVPVCYTEWGAYANVGELDLWIADTITVLEERSFHHCYHTWADNNGSFDVGAVPTANQHLLDLWATNA